MMTQRSWLLLWKLNLGWGLAALSPRASSKLVLVIHHGGRQRARRQRAKSNGHTVNCGEMKLHEPKLHTRLPRDGLLKFCTQLARRNADGSGVSFDGAR